MPSPVKDVLFLRLHRAVTAPSVVSLSVSCHVNKQHLDSSESRRPAGGEPEAISSGAGGVIRRRLPGPAVEDLGEILREASTALKLAQRLDQSPFFVVWEHHMSVVVCGERCLEHHAEIVGRGVRRARLELLDKQLGGFRRNREVPLVDRHAELLGDEPQLLEDARQFVDRIQTLSAPWRRRV